MDTPPYLHGLCALRPRVTALRLGALLREAGTVKAAWNAGRDLLKRSGWSDEAMTFFLQHRAAWDIAAEAERLEKSGIALVPLEDARTPALLREIYDPPTALYVRGDLSNASTPMIACVGSRKATPYGRTVTGILVRPLAAKGLTIISGLAYGIDAEAHRAALAVHGRTIAVLGGGIADSALYPRAHRGLAAEIIASGGAIVSEYPPETEARAEFFPQRNRIIAGLSHAVVIVEAAEGSGALITARLALAENRDVFAVPGPITSPLSHGTNLLLRDGAAPALSADDILEALALTEALEHPASTRRPLDANGDAPPAHTGVSAQEPSGTHMDRAAILMGPEPASTFVSPPRTTEQVFGSLGPEPKHIDEIVAACTLPPHEIAAALSLLELAGRVRDVGGKHYVRV